MSDYNFNRSRRCGNPLAWPQRQKRWSGKKIWRHLLPQEKARLLTVWNEKPDWWDA